MFAAFVLLGWILLVLYLLLTGILAHRRAAFYKRQAVMEETRRLFGEARFHLMQLVRDDKLSIRSRTFRVFYGLLTFIVRRPDAYRDIAGQFREVLLAPPDARIRSEMEREMRTWPNEINCVLEPMGKGIGKLIFLYPGIGSSIAFLVRHGPRIMWGVGRLAYRRLKRFSAFQVERDLLAAKSQIERFQVAPFTARMA